MIKKAILVYVFLLIFLGLDLSPCEAQQKQTETQETNNRSVLFPFRSSSDGLIGYINEQGVVVVRPQFAYKDHSTLSNRSHDGRAIVMKKLDPPDPHDANFKYGFIDESGEIVVDLKYDEVEQFSEGLAAVRINNTWGYIDRNGQTAISFRFAHASGFHCGLARVCAFKDSAANVSTTSKYECGFVDKTGKIVIKARDLAFSDFAEGLAVARAADGKFGYIDTEGQMVIPPTFYSAGNFSEGLAEVTFSSDSAGYIDKNGQTVIKGMGDGAFSWGRALIRKLIKIPPYTYGVRYVYINREGRTVIEEKFGKAEDFSEGLAAVSFDDGTDGYIDTDGRKIIGPFYDAEAFHNGLALVVTDEKTKVLIKDKADIGKDYTRQWHITYYKYAYIDRSGKVVFRWMSSLETPPKAGADGPQPGNDPSPVTVKVSSTPPDARVYFIPLALWEGDEKIIDDDARLFQYLKAKNTGTRDAPSTFSVYPDVYIVVVKLNGRKDKRPLDANRFNTNEVDIPLPQ